MDDFEYVDKIGYINNEKDPICCMVDQMGRPVRICFPGFDDEIDVIPVFHANTYIVKREPLYFTKAPIMEAARRLWEYTDRDGKIRECSSKFRGTWKSSDLRKTDEKK